MGMIYRQAIYPTVTAARRLPLPSSFVTLSLGRRSHAKGG